MRLLEQVSSEGTGPYPPEIKEALDTWRAAYKTFTGNLAARAIGDRPSTNDWIRTIVGKVSKECGINREVFARPIYDAHGKLDPSDANTLITRAVNSLPGATEDERKRAAQGALIKHDLLVRVQQAKTRPEPFTPRYSDKDQKDFDSVMASLFAPGGKHSDIDIKTAHAVLCFFADDGLSVSRDKFIEAMAEDNADTFLSLAAFRKATAGLKNAPANAEVRYSDTENLHIKTGIGHFLAKKFGTSSAADHKQTRLVIKRILNTHDITLGQRVIDWMKSNWGWTDESPVTVADIATIEEVAIELKRPARLPQGFWEETVEEFCEQYGDISPEIFREEHRDRLAKDLKGFPKDAPAKEVKRYRHRISLPDCRFSKPSQRARIPTVRRCDCFVVPQERQAVRQALRRRHRRGSQGVAVASYLTSWKSTRCRSSRPSRPTTGSPRMPTRRSAILLRNAASILGSSSTYVNVVVANAKLSMGRLMMTKGVSEGQFERIARVAVVATVAAFSRKPGTPDERKREIAPDVAASLFKADGAHKDLDIKLAYAAYKWLADRRLDADIKTFARARAAVERQSWLDRNYEKTLTRVCLRCGIEREDLGKEMLGQVTAIVSLMRDGATEPELERATQGTADSGRALEEPSTEDCQGRQSV